MASSLNGTGVTFSDGSTQSTGTSGDFKFNSGYGSVVTAYGCRAWVNFNGTGTVAIRASGNVSSITDNGTGDYTVNFTTAMPDANYAYAGSGGTNDNTSLLTVSSGSTQTTTAARLHTVYSNSNGNYDPVNVYVVFFR